MDVVKALRLIAYTVLILQNRHSAMAADKKSSTRDFKMFCYYSSYAQNRPEGGKFLPEDIDPNLCSHVIFAFADLVLGSLLKPSGWNDLPNGKDKGLYARTNALKEQNPSLKVLLAVGGWRAGSEPFIPMISSEEKRRTFIKNAIRFLRRHDFDGLDMDWEFPGTRGSGAQDKVLYTGLIKDMREAFENEAKEIGRSRLLLTMAVSGGSYYINLAYEPRKIAQYVDYLLIMGYNYHGSWNDFTGHHSGLFPRSDEVGGEREWNEAWTVDFWLNKAGAPPEKIILGIATYGMSYTLATSGQHGLKAAATGAGDPGKYTQEAGILAYYEICENLENGWKSVWISEQKVPYAYHEDQWVGYENMDSVAYKANYIVEKGLAGAFIWSLEMDDFKGACDTGPYPLLSTIAHTLKEGDVGNTSLRKEIYTKHNNEEEDDDDPYDDHYNKDGDNVFNKKSTSTITDRKRIEAKRTEAKQTEAKHTETKRIAAKRNEAKPIPSPSTSYYDYEQKDYYGFENKPTGDKRKKTKHSDDDDDDRVQFSDVKQQKKQQKIQRARQEQKQQQPNQKNRDISTSEDGRHITEAKEASKKSDQRQRQELGADRRPKELSSSDSSHYGSPSDVTESDDTTTASKYETNEKGVSIDYPDSDQNRNSEDENSSADNKYSKKRSGSKVHSKVKGQGSSKFDDSQFNKMKDVAIARRGSKLFDSNSGRRNEAEAVGTDEEEDEEDIQEDMIVKNIKQYGSQSVDQRSVSISEKATQQRRHQQQQQQYQQRQQGYQQQPKQQQRQQLDRQEPAEKEKYRPKYQQQMVEEEKEKPAPKLPPLSSSSNGSPVQGGDEKCERSGLFAQRSSCRSYFICVPHGTRWYKFHLTCPDGLAFKADSAACGRVDDCKD